MIELVITGMVTATAFSALITGGIQFMLNRQNRKITEQTQISAPVSQEMRDEIEQNEAWWLRSYHELMLKGGAKVVGRTHGMEITERNSYGNLVRYAREDRVALEGCICPECARVLKETKPVELRSHVISIYQPRPIVDWEAEAAYWTALDRKRMRKRA